MVSGRPGAVLESIRFLFRVGTVAGLVDAELLERFVARRDADAAEAAFTALVERHGPMVLASAGTCSATRTTPRTPSRRSSSSWRRRPARSATPTSWPTGSMGSPCGRRGRPGCGGPDDGARPGRLRCRGGNASATRADRTASRSSARRSRLHEEIGRLPKK